MPGIKELKTRIKSISGTRKVTRAMQMVSAAKMRKAQDATLKSRPYSALAWELIMNLSATAGEALSAAKPADNDAVVGLANDENTQVADSIELLRTHPTGPRIALLVLSSNRGLVGSLNSNLFLVLNKLIASEHAEGKTDIVAYGKKAREFAVRSSAEALANFEKHDRTIKIKDIYPVSEYISEIYRTGKYHKIIIVYNHFQSTLSQHPTVKQLLPFAQEITEPKSAGDEHTVDHTGYNYIFEPDPVMVFEHLLPRIIESQIYQTILESEASEQSARMVMMKNATEAAGDLISHLTLAYNKLRQNKITTELAEITAGKIALE